MRATIAMLSLCLLVMSCGEWQRTNYYWPDGQEMAVKHDWSSGSRTHPLGVVVSRWDCLGEPEAVCRWIYYHEVAHVVLGHSSLGVRGHEAELAADCWAIRELRGSRQDAVRVIWWLRGRGRSDTHPSGARRAAKIMECYR